MPHPPNRFNAVRLVRGQTKVLTVTVKDEDGRPAKLTGVEDVVMSIGRLGSEPTVVKRLGTGIQITDQANGKLKVTLSSTDTALAVGTYKYDLWIECPGEPPVRKPVVKLADITVEDRLTAF